MKDSLDEELPLRMRAKKIGLLMFDLQLCIFSLIQCHRLIGYEEETILIPIRRK